MIEEYFLREYFNYHVEALKSGKIDMFTDGVMFFQDGELKILFPSIELQLKISKKEVTR